MRQSCVRTARLLLGAGLLAGVTACSTVDRTGGAGGASVVSRQGMTAESCAYGHPRSAGSAYAAQLTREGRVRYEHAVAECRDGGEPAVAEPGADTRAEQRTPVALGHCVGRADFPRGTPPESSPASGGLRASPYAIDEARRTGQCP